MKLKSSNKGSYFFLGSLFLLTVLFLSLNSSKTVSSKYIPAPEGIEQKTILNFIQLTFSEKNYNKLKTKRDKALSLGILETSDADYVPATVTYNGTEFRAEVRLKGDWIDHFRDDKWSFRIKLKDDQTIMGMRKFSIHRPAARGFINEWLYHKAIKEENLMGLRYDFLEGKIHIKQKNLNSYNTKDVGIYAIEESFDKRTIESNKRKESVILKFSEDKFWSNVKKAKLVGNPSGILWKDLMNYNVDYPITVFGESNVLEDSIQNNYFKVGKNLLEDLYQNKTTIDHAFDVKALAMQNAILNLFGATHGIPLINVRFYYNPITSKLEPISFDGNSGTQITSYNHFHFVNQNKDSVYLKELAYALQKVVKPSYLDNLLNTNSKELTNYEKTLKKEVISQPFSPQNFKQNQKVILAELIRLKNKYQLTDINIEIESFENVSGNEILIPNISNWKKSNIKISKLNDNNNKRLPHLIERENNNIGSYVSLRDINIDPRKIVQVKIAIKKSTNESYFGLRIQGQYPSRVDAIFNANDGTLKGVRNAGDFDMKDANIKLLENNWYELTLSAKANTNKILLMFGPTDNQNWVLKWEGPTKTKQNSVIDILSIKIEQLD